MKRLAITVLAAAAMVETHPATDKRPVHWLTVSGTITGGTAKYVARGVARAEKENAAAVVIQLDTPGGVLDASWDLVETELNSRVPVVVWVGPRGAHAGSAGVFLTLAANVAAMAPATRIGAAHPVGIGERDDNAPAATPAASPSATPVAKASPGDATNVFEHPWIFRGDKEHLAQKIENDTVSWVASIAKERGRNVEWAKKAVLESDSITSDDAVSKNVVDLIATSPDDLLAKLDGRTVTTPAGKFTLATSNAELVQDPMRIPERIVTMLADPTLIAILLGIAMLGLYTEFQHPGAIFPAVAGGLALLAVLIGSQAIPIRYGALLLIAFGFLCFILEIKLTSYGVLTLGGVLGIGGGLILLVDRTTFSVPVSWPIAGPALAAIAGIAVFITFLAARAMRATPLGDLREWVGRVVSAHTALSPAGTVTVDGTFWHAVSSAPVPEGANVRITGAKGLTLEVEPASPPA